MKIQDVFFLATMLLLIFSKNPRYSVYLGLGCISLAIPLFALWVFFTAERLVWYAAGFFLFAIIFFFMITPKKKTK